MGDPTTHAPTRREPPATHETSDIRAGDWVDRWMPAILRPYLRLIRIDRPIGTWLLLFPGWWGVALASDGFPDLRLLALFAAGAFVMRGAGCTLNDLADRKIDARVARTAGRPIASGAIPVRAALVFLGLQLALGLVILLQFNRFAIALGAASLLLVAIYPFMKRVTYWPQAVLGLAFNWGALLGWAAVTETLDGAALALYVGGVFWTLGYDTIYAHQDRADDAIVGVRSTALLFGANTRPWLATFYVLTVLLWAAAGTLATAGWPYFLGLAGAALLMAWQVHGVRIDDPAGCLAKFRANRWIGWILLAGIITAHL